MRIKTLVTLLLTFLAANAAFAADPPPLQIAVSSHDVRIANVTPGGTVVLYSSSIASDGGLLRQRKVATTITDSARIGSVAFASNTPIPFRSVWIAVDLETSRYVVGGPDGYDVSLRPFPSTHLHGDAEGTIGLFDLRQLSGEMLIVRPKTGAWEVVAAEGGTNDGDRARNGKLSLSVDDAVPIAQSGPPPKRLKNGDIIAVIDPHRLDVVIAELDR
jgi:hypothetical protein